MNRKSDLLPIEVPKHILCSSMVRGCQSLDRSSALVLCEICQQSKRDAARKTVVSAPLPAACFSIPLNADYPGTHARESDILAPTYSVGGRVDILVMSIRLDTLRLTRWPDTKPALPITQLGY